MNANEYLESVLRSQTLEEGSEELETLRSRRAEVEEVLRDAYGSTPTIRYGGSIAKGTLIKEFYDLDVICYFPNDDESAGSTIAEIYDSVASTLQENYLLERKTSALRLLGAGAEDYGINYHIDVVPGRYVDDSRSDCFLYQNSAEKQRLKTNLDIHINHIKGSGVVDAVRLLKLWRVRRGLQVKPFVFELLTVEVLADKKAASLSEQLEHFWSTVEETEDPISVEDPANPTGNDLSDFLNRGVWLVLQSAASSTLSQIQSFGWESVFGEIEEEEEEQNRAPAILSAAAAVERPTRPWALQGEDG